ncbi:MAG: peptidylprolyl isomerase [Planctomycetes bacterium]|nr:peptidylprolyl isomerase [Planctomycetota bacterium]
MKTKISIFFLFVLILLALPADSFAANPQITLDIVGAVSGSIVLELYPEKAPVTVSNFIDYTRSGFYDGLIFHRVIEDFMIQGGGYDVNMVESTLGTPIIHEGSNGLSNLTGTIAMARIADPHSATSQFFINHTDNLFWDYGGVVYDNQNTAYFRAGYCVFGEVVSGMSVVNAIAVLPTTGGGDSDPNRPLENVIIDSATVTLEVAFNTEELEGDVDGDFDVDATDLSKFATQWLNPKCVGCYSADINGDGEVNFADFAKMSANWLNCTSITTLCE